MTAKMGNFRVQIDAVGGHGCERQIKSGEKTYGCGRLTCPDCLARFFVKAFQLILGCSVNAATITHWPGEKCEVVDDLLTGERKGNF